MARADQATRSGRHEDEPVHSVGELLDRIQEAAEENDATSVGNVLDHVGERSFGPILLLAGLVMMAPVVGDIPGVPTLMGLMVILVAGQFLMRRDHIWLPDVLLRRSVSHTKIEKGIKWMRPVARFLDRWSKRRLTPITHRAGFVVIASTSIVIAAATPVMEVVPFSANLAGVAITAYGLALIAADGLIAILAMVFSAGTFVLIVRQLV